MAWRRRYMTRRLPSGGTKTHRAAVVFATRRGCIRDAYAVTGYEAWLGVAGITRHVRWHDLRHTCASSLVAGWWGRPWRLEEVRDFLGHSSVTVTERYAHLAMTVMASAALEAETAWSRGGHNMMQGAETVDNTSEFLKRWPNVRLVPGAQMAEPARLVASGQDEPDPESTVARDHGVTNEGGEPDGDR